MRPFLILMLLALVLATALASAQRPRFPVANGLALLRAYEHMTPEQRQRAALANSLATEKIELQERARLDKIKQDAEDLLFIDTMTELVHEAQRAGAAGESRFFICVRFEVAKRVAEAARDDGWSVQRSCKEYRSCNVLEAGVGYPANITVTLELATSADHFEAYSTYERWFIWLTPFCRFDV